jgi:hypothetical protein
MQDERDGPVEPVAEFQVRRDPHRAVDRGDDVARGDRVLAGVGAVPSIAITWEMLITSRTSTDSVGKPAGW